MRVCGVSRHPKRRVLQTTGVIWRGDSVIDGVPETLDALRALVRVLSHHHSSRLMFLAFLSFEVLELFPVFSPAV